MDSINQKPATSENAPKKGNIVRRWIISIVQGAIIGTGAIIPGVSGGVLAVIFGIYEPLMKFLANIRVDFKKNALRFMPIFIGIGAGFVVLSKAVNWLLGQGEAQVIWLFIGAIVGTLPALFKHAGREGRKTNHFIILGVATVITYLFLWWVSTISAAVTPNFFLWIVAGILVVSGAIVPGLSPSNFLMTMNMYKPMTAGISSLDFSILIPLAIGGIFCLFAFSKIVNYLIERFHTTMFHIIFGVVIASTLKIIPMEWASYGSALGAGICVLTFAAGAALGFWMSILEKKYKDN